MISMLVEFNSIYRVQNRELPLLQGFISKDWLGKFKELFSDAKDPPIPPGAIKFSYSTRLSELRITLCDTDIEYIDIKVSRIL